MTSVSFLAGDNIATLALLLDQRPRVGSALATRIEDLQRTQQASDSSDHSANSDHTEAERNRTLRSLLVEVIDALDDQPSGIAARQQIAAHLKQRIANDPAMQRKNSGR